MAQHCIHCYVSGIVQGVYYRDSTRKKANELGITGWIKNLPDGRVEIMACGEEQQLKILEKWLWQGPPAAKVTQVIVQPAAVNDCSEFIIRH